MNDIRIRAVEREDIPGLAALETACFPDPWTESALGMLTAKPYGGLCALQGEDIVGYVGWLHFPAMGDNAAEAEITRIAVSPAARRRGIGRALLERMFAVLNPDGAPMSAYLDVRESNRAAQALYESLGFVQHGTRPRFYGDEDAREYALHL